MIGDNIAAEYRQLNSVDRSAFHRWILANTIVGAASILGLIVLASVYSGGDSGSSVTAQKQPITTHAEAR